MAGSSASSNSDSEGEVKSSAAEAEIFIRLAPISFDEDGYVRMSGWWYRERLSIYTDS